MMVLEAWKKHGTTDKDLGPVNYLGMDECGVISNSTGRKPIKC